MTKPLEPLPASPDQNRKVFALLAKTFQILLGFSLIALGGVTFASFFGRSHILELTSHFRLLYLIATGTGLVCATAMRSKLLIALALVLVTANAIPVVPYYVANQPARTGQTQPLKLMLANVAVGNTHYPEFLSLVAEEDPDLLIVEEYTPEWETAVGSLRNKYPHYLGSAKQGGAGIALFSRFPLGDAHLIDFDGSAHDGIFAAVEINGLIVNCVALHPLPPTSGDKFASRNRQLAATGSILRPFHGPKILIGDLNTSIWSSYYRDLVCDTEMRDARLGFGLLPTWPNPLPWLVRIPIDNCLVSNEIHVERMRIGPDIGSDHLPLLVELRVSQGAK